MKTSYRSSYDDAMSLFPSTHGPAVQRRLSDTTVVDLQRLQRIKGVNIEHSVTRNGHRYFIIEVSRQSPHPIPSLASLSTYRVHRRYSGFRTLYTAIHDRAVDDCPVCLRLRDLLEHDHKEPSRMRQLTGPTPAECARLTKLLDAVLGHALLYAAPNAIDCVGCEWVIRLLATFFKEEYQPSTGLI